MKLSWKFYIFKQLMSYLMIPLPSRQSKTRLKICTWFFIRKWSIFYQKEFNLFVNVSESYRIAFCESEKYIVLIALFSLNRETYKKLKKLVCCDNHKTLLCIINYIDLVFHINFFRIPFNRIPDTIITSILEKIG